jgi:hypothetical protein
MVRLAVGPAPAMTDRDHACEIVDSRPINTTRLAPVSNGGQNDLSCFCTTPEKHPALP